MSKPQLAIAAALLLTAACASDDGGDMVNPPVSVPQQAAAATPDPRVGELQTQLTELLERLDVMNSRLARLEEAPATPAPAAPIQREMPAVAQPEAVAVTPQQPQQSQQPQRALIGAQLAEEYRQAIILFGRGRHADARRAFEAVFASDAAGDLADNALFWIGETWFAAGNYTNAMRYYARVVNEFSDQNKAPDALFKMALSHERTGDLALARKTLQQVIDKYPYSSTASTAKAELQRIKY